MQYKFIQMKHLANSSQAVIQVRVSDGELSGVAVTNQFVKNTPRLEGPPVNHMAGTGGASITVSVLDPSQLTGDLYRMTIDATTCCPNRKAYRVLDVDRDRWVVDRALEMDGVSEGPPFDGVRLIIKDFDPPVVDLEHTGWSKGSSTVETSVYLPEINLGTEVLKGAAYPADYLITLRDHISDTSSSAYGAQPVHMYFDVWNITEKAMADVIFIDTDGNQTISRLDELFVLFGDEPYLTWALLFCGPPSAVPPRAGDEFMLCTLKPLTFEDVYEFRTVSMASQKGDINTDQFVDVSDVLLVVSFILQTASPSEEEFWAADCNGQTGICEGDGLVNALDIVQMARIILGLDECR
jgi:hypothetical protein